MSQSLFLLSRGELSFLSGKVDPVINVARFAFSNFFLFYDRVKEKKGKVGTSFISSIIWVQKREQIHFLHALEY